MPEKTVPTVRISNLRHHVDARVRLRGWLYNHRGSKNLFFLMVRDGSGVVQTVVSQADVSPESWQAAEQLTQECALEVTGTVRRDERQIGGFEVSVESVSRISSSDAYPISPKAHGVEFLMNNRHLWLRSRRQWAVLRVRNRIIMSIHELLQGQGFIQADSPILTGNAVEGTSTLFEIDYFGDRAYLTQSGQLYGEAMAMAHGKIYTFGPTFRAEKSKTRRHLTEFWMIEPEMAFYDLEMNMQLAEELIERIVGDVLRDCREELEVLGRPVGVLEGVSRPFPRLSYDDAVDLLRSPETALKFERLEEELHAESASLSREQEDNQRSYGQARKGEKRRIDARSIDINVRLEEIGEELRNLPSWRDSALGFEWGGDFGGSDETVLAWHFDRPIIVHRFPAAIKAFYMKRDPDDDRLALGMDVLAPEGFGEIIGGGQRADDLDFLEDQIRKHDLPREAFEWYLDLRRYGSVPHSGFGLGLERTVAWICGLPHVRETIPFPRMLGRLNP